MGNAIAMVNTFSKVSYKEKHWKNRNWLYILNMEYLDHKHPNYYEVKEIGSYTYEAMSTSKGMILESRGKGSKYLGAYVDENKEWLDGKNTYVIVIPKDAPASQFWSLTVYDNDTRCLIINDQKKSDLSSVMNGVKVEADGSTKIFVGTKVFTIGCQSKRVLICVKKVRFILRERKSQMLSAKVGCDTNSINKRYEISLNYTNPCNGLVI